VLISVLRPGPARRVDPGSVVGPGLSKKQARDWLGQTRSTRRADLGPGRPGQTRLRPEFIFFISSCPKRRRFGLLQLKEQRDECIAEQQKWEEDLINFKKLSNPFHSQSRRRADEQKTLEFLIAVSILSIRLDEFLLVSFFFRLSLSSVSSSSLCWTCRRV